MAKRKITNEVLSLATYPPRECGIATFTRDLTNAIRNRFYPTIDPRIIALNNDSTDIYNYNKNVVSQLVATNIDDYIKLAKKLNKNGDVKLIHVQHEFGIFGGDYGNYLLPFLQVIEKPVVITFHSVLPNPEKDRGQIVRSILENVEAVVVMDELSKKVLIEDYEARESKIFIIPHGIPQTTFNNSEKEKERLGLSGKIIVSTHGLLSKGKGVEYAIRSLPRVVKKYPNLLFLIIGETHPDVRKMEGEKYRNYLKKEVERLKLKNNVKFYNKYLPLDELVSYIKASDICITTNLEARQAASGVLAYDLGCGRPVISTKYDYAKSLINPAKGILVNFRDSRDITNALLKMLKDPKKLHEMSRIAYIETRNMTWSNVALAHFNLYKKYIKFKEEKEKLPSFTLKHLIALTDNFGVIQFAKHVRPDRRHGYSLDDNTRAMIVIAKAWDRQKQKETLDLLEIYLSFIKSAQRSNGKFVNLFSREKKVSDPDISEDSQGRAVWALGYIIAQTKLPERIRRRAKTIFRKAVLGIGNIKSPRAIAFTIMGLYFYNKAYPKSQYLATFKKLAERQTNIFVKSSSKDWPWFEDALTYSNSILPESLFYAHLVTKKEKYLRIAEESLCFLMNITFEEGRFEPVGQNGWYRKSGRRAYFDQQPEETASMVQTMAVAYQTTKKEKYKKRAVLAFEWFLGKNHLGQMIYNESTGGCYDGLGQYSVNINQGAESTISYLLARLNVEEVVSKDFHKKLS